MDRTLVCLVVAGLLGAEAASAAPTNDCRNFDRGTEIVGNIAKRYYQPTTEDTSLLFKILKGMQADAEQAKALEDGALLELEPGGAPAPGQTPPATSAPDETEEPAIDEGERVRPRPGTRRNNTRTNSSAPPSSGTTDGCGARKTKLRNLISSLDQELQANKDAQEKCQIGIGTENFGDRAQECYEAAVKVMDLDYKIGLDEDGPTVAARDGELIRFMASIATDGCDAPGTWPVQEQVHKLIAPRPCARDGSYCYMTRIGKLREARGHLGQVGEDPLQGIVGGVNGPLLKEAEHKFWFLRDHPETDNREIFLGIYKLSRGYEELAKGLQHCSE
ncbi:MAG: hypothetical protein HY553_19185 [Elusimicrobia bacterium]|nr:hypothetical protein [Elusimicrobiota bacterium]